MRDSIIFYRSFYEAINELPLNVQGKVYSAIFEYSLNYNEIELSGLPKTIFTLIKPQLDANNRRFENGKKGGRKKSDDIQSETKTEPKQNQSETKSETNNNVNVNVNDNNNNNILLKKETKKIILENQDSDNFSKTQERKKVAPKKERYFNKDDFKKKLLDLGVEEKHANDWIQIRKDKKASFTESSIDGIIRECKKQNYPFPDAIRNCAENNWQGFKYEWVKNKNQNGQFGNNQSTNNGFSKNSGNTNGSQNGKIAARTILAQRLGARNTEEVSDSGSGNITVDVEVVE